LKNRPFIYIFAINEMVIGNETDRQREKKSSSGTSWRSVFRPVPWPAKPTWYGEDIEGIEEGVIEDYVRE
jgi:hypothetical protein